ncbi:hypothetical protein AQUCO_10800042v1 [Aquilegia coerulea]|uniref:Thioredoxin domain-containing protein n=1 Tax=Aquilegia coerulea TaxID=218851 RepID=A0A2G5C3B9_AQUCA|nr:hypothetical protein AQUCO_10800042v1 [Aquilegia coerulea]
MALHQISSSSSSSSSMVLLSRSSATPLQPCASLLPGGDRWSSSFSSLSVFSKKNKMKNLEMNKRRRTNFVTRSSLETPVEVVVGQVTEVNKDTFWPLVNASGDKVVVLDMYTQWCGPCKVIAPKYKELSEKHLDVVFLKLDCNQENKALAKELGLRVVPTFKILKDSKVVKEVTGAKLDDLVFAIETAKSS